MSDAGVPVGGLGRAGACSVLEEDWQRGQSYSATWHSLRWVPQHQHRATVLEVERSRRQSLSRQWESVTQGPPGAGTHNARSPARPTSTSSALRARAHRGPTTPPILEEVRCVSVPKRAVVGGVGDGRELPHVRTTVVGRSKMQRSLGRVLSQEAHRG